MSTKEKLLKAIEEYRKVERACPANQKFLGDALCPKCRATPKEPCRETVRASYIVTQVAKQWSRSLEG